MHCLDDKDDQIWPDRHQNVRCTVQPLKNSQLVGFVAQVKFSEFLQEVLTLHIARQSWCLCFVYVSDGVVLRPGFSLLMHCWHL